MIRNPESKRRRIEVGVVHRGQQEADAGRDRAAATDDQPLGAVGVAHGVTFKRCRIVLVVVVALLADQHVRVLTKLEETRHAGGRRLGAASSG